MAYRFHLPIPLNSARKNPATSVVLINHGNIAPLNITQSRRGISASKDIAHASGKTIIDIGSDITWRGDLARSWVIHYLRNYIAVSSLFLDEQIGILDTNSTIASLQGKDYCLPIDASQGLDVDTYGNNRHCIWYSLNDQALEAME